MRWFAALVIAACSRFWCWMQHQDDDYRRREEAMTDDEYAQHMGDKL